MTNSTRIRQNTFCINCFGVRWFLVVDWLAYSVSITPFYTPDLRYLRWVTFPDHLTSRPLPRYLQCTFPRSFHSNSHHFFNISSMFPCITISPTFTYLQHDGMMTMKALCCTISLSWSAMTRITKQAAKVRAYRLICKLTHIGDLYCNIVTKKRKNVLWQTFPTHYAITMRIWEQVRCYLPYYQFCLACRNMPYRKSFACRPTLHNSIGPTWHCD